MTMTWDRRAVTDATRGPEVDKAMLDLGWQIAERAAALAPKETGGGASSIRAERVIVNGIPEVRVSWDRDHFYMSFHEFGTENSSPHPFLRPAAEGFQ